MQTSKVYWTDMRVNVGESLLDKLLRLMKAAGMDTINFNKKFTAIKIHFGEPGNLSFLRPNFAKAVADAVKARGGNPFLTDCNTLYAGRRKNALEHLESAWENGFTPLSCGCPVIIADGLRGTDETLVPLSGTEYVKEAKIGHAIMDADVILSLNHFKGHEATGFGGAIKNIGMGCGSRAGKMEQHAEGKPVSDPEACRGCRVCARFCAHDAIRYGADKKAFIDHDLCVGCGRCMGACPYDAIDNDRYSSERMLCMKMAEYALAVLKDRPGFHINIVMQVSPYCDCHGENDAPIIPDVGMFCSFDPVALDMACADACNHMPAIENSALGEALKAHEDLHDHFTNTFPATDWRITMEHAEKIGLGSRSYELIPVQ